MRYIICFALISISFSAFAQTINGASKENTSDEVLTSANQPTTVTAQEDMSADAKEEPAVVMTPEQKAEIDSKAKKNMRISVKKQSVRERKDFIDVMTSSEKILARRQALRNGQGKAAASLAEAGVKKPDFNPAADREMEDYLFEKAGLPQQDIIRGSDAK